MSQENCPYRDKNPPVGTGGMSPASLGEDTCEFAGRLIMEALDGHQPQLEEAAQQKLKNCASCLNILQLQIKLRQTVTTHLRISAPKQLRINISQSLKRVNLGELTIGDFPPPNPKPPRRDSD